MASRSQIQILSVEEQEKLFDEDMVETARQAVATSDPAWAAVESFLVWARGLFKNFLEGHLSRLPVVGRWAGRIGTTISDLVFTVMGTTLHFLKVVLTSPHIWTKAHNSAMVAWSSNEKNGLLSQTYAYAKKMTAYFLEIIKQCLERAIEAHGLEVTNEDRIDISNSLDDLLKKLSF